MTEEIPRQHRWPRVCHIIGLLRIGGAERQVVNLLNELPKEQAFVVILGKDAGPLAAQLRPEVRIRKSAMRWRSLPRDIWRLARLLRELEVDVVQTHMFWANFTGIIAAKLGGIPVKVTTEHGKNVQKPYWARWVERHLISTLCDKRICVSEDIRRLRHTVDGVAKNKLCIVSNGTPIREQKRLRERSDVSIGTLGRLIEAKDYPMLIEAMRLLKERGVKCRLTIVGDGPERERLAAEIDQRQLQEIVDLPGFSEDVQAALEEFDIYVISSIREGQPVSLLEAMAVGLPIVATSVGGIPDTIEHGTEALLVPPRDATAMADALAKLVLEFRLRQQLGAAARERLIRDYSIDASLRRHLEIYRSIREDKRA